MSADTTNLQTLARVASEHGLAYADVRRAAAGEQPSLVLNATAYFAPEAVERIVAAAAGTRTPGAEPRRPVPG